MGDALTAEMRHSARCMGALQRAPAAGAGGLVGPGLTSDGTARPRGVVSGVSLAEAGLGGGRGDRAERLAALLLFTQPSSAQSFLAVIAHSSGL